MKSNQSFGTDKKMVMATVRKKEIDFLCEINHVALEVKDLKKEY